MDMLSMLAAAPTPPWRSIAAVGLMLCGVATLAWGLRLQISWHRRKLPPSPRKSLDLVRFFRAGLVGLGMVGAGAGLFWDIEWLLFLALIIGGQELLETTVMALALKDEEKRRAMETQRAA